MSTIPKTGQPSKRVHLINRFMDLERKQQSETCKSFDEFRDFIDDEWTRITQLRQKGTLSEEAAREINDQLNWFMIVTARENYNHGFEVQEILTERRNSLKAFVDAKCVEGYVQPKPKVKKTVSLREMVKKSVKNSSA